MGRRGSDLFELLEARTRGSGGAPRESRSKHQSAGALRSAAAKLGEILQREGQPKRKRKGWFTRGKRGPSRAWTMSGSWAGILALACLAVGFLLGRGTGNAQAAGSLDTKAPATQEAQKPQAPEHLPSLDAVVKGAPDLSIQEEIKELSDTFFLVVAYPVPEPKRLYAVRQRASELAHYLRQHGIDTARIKIMEPAGGGSAWAVLVYVPDRTQQQTYLDRLLAVTPPSFEPAFAERLKEQINLLEFTH